MVTDTLLNGLMLTNSFRDHPDAFFKVKQIVGLLFKFKLFVTFFGTPVSSSL